MVRTASFFQTSSSGDPELQIGDYYGTVFKFHGINVVINKSANNGKTMRH